MFGVVVYAFLVSVSGMTHTDIPTNSTDAIRANKRRDAAERDAANYGELLKVATRLGMTYEITRLSETIDELEADADYWSDIAMELMYNPDVA